MVSRAWVVPIEVDDDQSDSDDSFLRVGFPFGSAYRDEMSPGYRLVLERFISGNRAVVYRGSTYIFIGSSGTWVHSHSTEACIEMNLLLDLSNVSVNYYAAALPYLRFLDMHAVQLGNIPNSVCIGIHRVSYQVSENKLKFSTVHNVMPLNVDYCVDEYLRSAFCCNPLRIGHLPCRINVDVTSPAEEVLLATMRRDSLDTLMWCIGNSLRDPVQTPRMLFLFGEGGNGKSVAINTLISNLPCVVATLSRDYIGRTTQQLTETDLERIMTHRFICYGDVVLNRHRQVNEAFLKIVSGNDAVTSSRMSGRLQCGGLFATNALWKAYPSVMMPWFSRRVVCVELNKPQPGTTQPREHFTEQDVLKFVARCLHIRERSKHLLVSTREALLSLFGDDVRIVTRGVVIDENATYMQSLTATYVICTLAGLTMDTLIDIVRALSPPLIIGPAKPGTYDPLPKLFLAIRHLRVDITPY
uniref:AlNc14C654G12337 protein n=1 Tax=Albugo laibachii Nc14 TaxID=890382 RepID=F0X1M5_9STRA|nr:AlNc14C654G12337 [Albugo laibachii Nc14]|eukprot:CCA27721.1 AlNc14C654G12337 [Albugo laibachii Nc14]